MTDRTPTPTQNAPRDGAMVGVVSTSIAARLFEPQRDGLWAFGTRVIIAIGLCALAYAAWKLSYVLMLLFAAILLAVILRSIASLLVKATGIKLNVAISLSTLGVVAVLSAFTYLFGSQMYGQLKEVASRLPQALAKLSEVSGIDVTSESLTEHLKQFASSSSLPGAIGFGSSAVGVLADLFIILVGGVYLASDARTYKRGVSLLFPEPQRSRLNGASGQAANALTQWFFGQLIAMTAVGLASWAAFAWIGLPSAGVLALMAGVSDFVPMLGPIVGGIPALVVASTQGMETFLLTLGAIVVIQQLESYVLMPIIQKRAVDLPPALGIFSIVVFGSLFGLIGVVLAVPLAVLLMVFVQQLWVNEVLGEDVDVVGQE